MAIAALVVIGGACSSDSAGAPESSTTSPSTTISTSTGPSETPSTDSSAACAVVAPEKLVPKVGSTIPHDADAYTQGLLIHDGTLFESTGQYGRSELRTLDPDTGDVLTRADLPPDVFGEGLTASGDELVQLTWKEGIAYRWSADQFDDDASPMGEFAYDGEGWGLTTLADGTLAMSNGSDQITLRDPATFAVLSTHRIVRDGGPTDELNELEWDGESLWANRYQTDEILRIDPRCWTVTGVVDASALRSDAEDRADDTEIDVTNGIAHVPDTDRFLLTGKWWPTMYDVQFVPVS